MLLAPQAELRGANTGVLTGRGFYSPERRGAGGLPLRNVEELLDGRAGGGVTFEDIYGSHEVRDPSRTGPVTAGDPELLVARRDDFQVNFIALVRRAFRGMSYGLGIDDVVVEWIETRPVADRTPCADPGAWQPDADGSPSIDPELASGCAVLSWDRSTLTEPEAALTLTVIDRNAQFGPDGIDQPPGAPDNDDQANDLDGDGLAEMQVHVFSDVDLAGETVVLEQTRFVSPVYTAVVRTSASRGLTSGSDGIVLV